MTILKNREASIRLTQGFDYRNPEQRDPAKKLVRVRDGERGHRRYVFEDDYASEFHDPSLPF